MARKDRLLRDAERGKFLITITADGAAEESFEGVLVEWDDEHVVLAAAYSVAETGDRLKLDGYMWLPRPRIKYMQAVTT